MVVINNIKGLLIQKTVYLYQETDWLIWHSWDGIVIDQSLYPIVGLLSS